MGNVEGFLLVGIAGTVAVGGWWLWQRGEVTDAIYEMMDWHTLHEQARQGDKRARKELKWRETHTYR